MKSKVCGILQHGSAIEALQCVKHGHGRRIRFWCKGTEAWASTHAKDGSVLLAPLGKVDLPTESANSDSEDDGDDDKSESEAESVDDVFVPKVRTIKGGPAERKILSSCTLGHLDKAMDGLKVTITQPNHGTALLPVLTCCGICSWC
jgi:hypothetical protein